MSAANSSGLNHLRGARLQAIRLDPRRPEGRFDLHLTKQGEEYFASLTFLSIQYSRFEFDDTLENGVVELISVEAEACPIGIRVFGELSNGTFELVCSSYRVDRLDSSGVA